MKIPEQGYLLRVYLGESDAWHGRPVWFHGDLSYLNLLARDGTLCGVVDWGACGVGDPTIDTLAAWSLFPPEARDALALVLAAQRSLDERALVRLP